MYEIDSSVFNALEKIKERLESDFSLEEEFEEGLEEDESDTQFVLDSNLISCLENIKERLSEDASAPGDGGAYNELDDDAALELYLDQIVDALIDKGYSEGDAVDFVLDIADEMAEEGTLPPMPDEDSDESEVALWLGTASTVGFGTEVLSAA